MRESLTCREVLAAACVLCAHAAPQWAESQPAIHLFTAYGNPTERAFSGQEPNFWEFVFFVKMASSDWIHRAFEY